MEPFERWTHPGTVAGAAALERLEDARVGADRGAGKYAVYFYDREGDEIRSVGGFTSVGDAARAIPFIRAEQVVEDALVATAEVES